MKNRGKDIQESEFGNKHKYVIFKSLPFVYNECQPVHLKQVNIKYLIL